MRYAIFFIGVAFAVGVDLTSDAPYSLARIAPVLIALPARQTPGSSME